MDENLVIFGDAVKALGEGKVGGYIVRWGNPKDVDLTGDYFTPETDLGIEEGDRLPVYYNHGYDGVMKNRKLGKGGVKFDDVGAWLDAQLEMRDEYEEQIYKLAEAGKLGWSTGAAGHLVERVSIGKSWEIKSWPIAEASLTTQPAEYRNAAVPVKSLYQPDESQDITTEEVTMTEEIKAPTIDVEAIVSSAVEKALKSYEESKPQVKAGFDVVEDEADRAAKGNPFTAGEFFQAVKTAATYPGQEDMRLKPLKATGLNEAMPSQGGYLVPPQIAAGIQENMFGVGSLLSFFNPIQVEGNSLTINAIDETSRADGSRMGGVQGYWMAEAGTKTASKPKFRQIELKLKKCAALCYATDELLEDATALQSWITNSVPQELRFKVEQAIVNGDGIGKPLGMLQAGCLVSAVRTDASEIDALDLARMWAARYPGVSDYVWLANSSIYPQLFNLSVGQMPVYLPAGGLSASPYGQIFGRPVVETEYNPYLGTLGDIMLVSPSQYAMIAKGGIQSTSSIHVNFVYDETAFRFVYRVDGQPLWASAITAYDGTTSLSPFVALAAST